MIGHNHLPSLIAIHGKKRSGKGTVASYLERVHGYEIVKFADPLKDMLRVLLRYCGFDENTIERMIEADLKEDPLDILGGKSARYAMQTLGTEWRVLIDPSLWIRIALQRVRTHRAAGRRVAIDDLRFPLELSALSAEGAALWRVTNNRLNEADATAGHASEVGLPPDDFPVHLVNDTSFEALYAQIDAVLAVPLEQVA